MRSLYWVVRVSRSSSTGPQYRDWHSAGVASITATGLPAPITVSSDTSCNGHGGLRVQIGSTPSGFAAVGDAARGAAVPGTGAFGWSCTWNASEAFCRFPSFFTWTTPSQEPACGTEISAV